MLDLEGTYLSLGCLPQESSFVPVQAALLAEAAGLRLRDMLLR